MSESDQLTREQQYDDRHGLEKCASCGVKRPKAELAPGHAKHDPSIKGNICHDRVWCEHHTHGREKSCPCVDTLEQQACAPWCIHCSHGEALLEHKKRQTLSGDGVRHAVENFRRHVARGRIAELEAESADSDQLIERQSSLLTATVNMLRGAPPSGTLWSHHDVADLARQWVDRAHVAESERDSWKARAELKTIQRDAAQKRIAELEARLAATQSHLHEERLRAIRAEADHAKALDTIEHAFLNSRSITGGDERRMRAVLEEHRPTTLKEKP